MRGPLKIGILGVVAVGLLFAAAACKKETPAKLQTELLPLDGNPLIHIKIQVNIGSANDPAGKEGLAQLTWSMLANGGSRLMPIQEINEKFYPLAAYVASSVDKERSTFSGTIHRDNLEKFYAIFKDMLLDPGFRQEDFDRIKTNQLNFLEKTLPGNMDEEFGKQILNLMLYEGHPYSHHMAGTAESVRNLTLDDVKAFYKEYFVQGNIIAGLAGGYPAEFVTKITADFSKLPAAFTPTLVLPEPRKPNGIEIFIAEKQTPATALSFGFPMPINRSSNDFFALWIAGAHFGEHRQSLSHLYQKIREQRGQNYGDYAYIEHFFQGRDKFPATNYARQQQYFSVWIRPLANSNRHFVIRQVMKELRQLIEAGIPEERFELVRTYLLNYTKLYAQTINERLGWQMDSRAYGYQDFLAEAQTRLPKLTREDVNNAIKKYLNFNNIYIAVVTEDGEGLKKALVENTPSPVKYANPKMPKEILDEDQIYQVYPLEVKTENVKIIPASEFFQKKGLPQK